jgi:hypothetical protein
MFGLARDLVDQVMRHALRQRVAAHDEGDLARMVGEVQRRLARELPAPIRNTSWPCVELASLREAP